MPASHGHSLLFLTSGKLSYQLSFRFSKALDVAFPSKNEDIYSVLDPFPQIPRPAKNKSLSIAQVACLDTSVDGQVLSCLVPLRFGVLKATRRWVC